MGADYVPGSCPMCFFCCLQFYWGSQVMRARFGLDGMKQRSLEEVGRDFDISRERVRQIEARAMHKLRQPYRNYRVRDFAYGSVQDMSQSVKSDPASVAAAAATIAEAEAVDRKAKSASRRAKMHVPPSEDDAKPETLGVRSELQSRADKAANRKDQEKHDSTFEPMEDDLGASADWDVDDEDFEACGKWIEGGFNLDDDNFLLTTLNRFDEGSGKGVKKDGELDSGAGVRPGAHPGSDSEAGSVTGSNSGADLGTESAYAPANASETLARLRSEMESHPMGLGGRSTSDANASSLQLA